MTMTSPLLQFSSSIAIIGLMVFIGCAATYVMLQWSFKRRLGAMRLEIENELGPRMELAPVAKAAASGAAAASVTGVSKRTSTPVAPVARQQSAEELAHETLVLIAAAVSAFLGKSVTLRSARLIHPSEGSAWAQQGRVFVQASHNLGLAPRLHG
jgi:hypothetical protein